MEIENNFWVKTEKPEEFNSTDGFDRLVKRLKTGRKTTKDLSDFIERRAKIEEEYAKNLAKLAKSNIGLQESSGFRDSLKSLQDQTHVVALNHERLSKELFSQSERLKQYANNYSETRKKKEDEVKKCQTSKRDEHSKLINAKINYQKKCSAYEQARTNCERPTVDAKESEKMNRRKEQTQDEKEKAKQIYCQYLKSVESARVKWIEAHRDYCREAQTTESDRPLLLQKEMWIYLNTISTVLLETDQAHDDVRYQIGKFDQGKDLQEFIENYQTGSAVPGPIEFESFEVHRAAAAQHQFPTSPLTQIHIRSTGSSLEVHPTNNGETPYDFDNDNTYSTADF